MSDGDMDARADAEEREVMAEKTADELNDEIKRLRGELDSLRAARNQKSEELSKAHDQLEVARLEERFAENPENETFCRELHVARVAAGWSEFKVNTASGVDPRTVIPWVATREVNWSEVWPADVYDRETPDGWWLKPEAKVLEGGRVMKVGNHRVCDDGLWRRDVTQEFDVVAVEDLAHLCSLVTRMEDMILYKPDVTGLQTLTIFDQGGS